MEECKLCKAETKCVFNISFSKVPICDNCATAIFKQQANWYIDQFKNKTACGVCKGISGVEYLAIADTHLCKKCQDDIADSFTVVDKQREDNR